MNDGLEHLAPLGIDLTEQQRDALRARFRMVLADHGRVSIDDLDTVVEDLLRAVTA